MVDFVENQVPAGETIELRFTRNTPYNGVDYGPDYESDTAQVDARQAKIWIEKGRAVLASDAPAEEADILTMSLAQLSKLRKDKLVAIAGGYGIPTVPDEMTNKVIAQLIYDHVHGKPE